MKKFLLLLLLAASSSCLAMDESKIRRKYFGNDLATCRLWQYTYATNDTEHLQLMSEILSRKDKDQKKKALDYFKLAQKYSSPLKLFVTHISEGLDLDSDTSYVTIADKIKTLLIFLSVTKSSKDKLCRLKEWFTKNAWDEFTIKSLQEGFNNDEAAYRLMQYIPPSRDVMNLKILGTTLSQCKTCQEKKNVINYFKFAPPHIASLVFKTFVTNISKNLDLDSDESYAKITEQIKTILTFLNREKFDIDFKTFYYGRQIMVVNDVLSRIRQ